MAKVHTSFTQVEVQILVFKNTLVKVEVLTKLNLLSPEPVFQASGSKMPFPEQMTISSERVKLILFILKVMINL